MNRKKPLLSFEFAGKDGKIKPLTFQNPLKIIAAYSTEEVLPCFELMQHEVSKGYYAAGFLSYESAAAFDSAFAVRTGGEMPLLWFGIFSEPISQTLESSEAYTSTEWKPSVSMDEYHQSIQKIKELIEYGETYQANYTIRLNSHFTGDDIAFYDQLKRAQASNYCAYINTGEHSILSASPELFFHLYKNEITTKPMKGTIKRGKSFEEDQEKAEWLYHSEKNRAENVMIVDLLRNDLGVIAVPGTVTVPKLFEIEHYPTVHQMTSTITAQVSENTTMIDIFKALFPCGSITGAPKISTMEIIAELETTPREVYCGAIGYITPEKEAIFNVPIRTVIINTETGAATYGVGGGITWDSTSENEYHEILAKASLLKKERNEFQLLESLLLESGEYFLQEEHLQRLTRSAQYFKYHSNLVAINQMLEEFAKKHEEGMFKVRLLIEKDGEVQIEGQPISKHDKPLKVILADQPIDKNNLFFYHKTTKRDIYSSFQKPDDVFDVLLWNEDGEITEFVNGNVVLEMDGGLWTPPVQSGLLAGTFREYLLKTGVIHEKVLTKADLERCTRVYFINSVRKWIEVTITQPHRSMVLS